MAYEVDFFPGVTGGAAVTVRWGVPGKYKVLVYDGGAAISGPQLVRHIRTHYQTSRVDYMVSSHPASDHSEGLVSVLEQLEIGQLWMHRPVAAPPAPADDGSIPAPRRLALMATARGIPTFEPFEGDCIGPFTVLSPLRQWYEDSLAPAISAAPARPQRDSAADLRRLMQHAGGWFGSRLNFEMLSQRAKTSPENESSAVLYAEFDGRGVMLTGRAGIGALSGACACAERLGISLPQGIRLLQVPNHGEADNLSSQVLDRMVGPRAKTHNRRYDKSAFVAIGLDGSSKRYQIAADALKRRGVVTFATQGAHLHHSLGMPDREWRPARPVNRDVW